jgi:hypothetical protein
LDYQLAIETIKSNYPPENYTMVREALDLAIRALQKQIPMSPIKKNWSPSTCPDCKTELSESLGDGYYKDHTTLKYCKCGQKLNWE